MINPTELRLGNYVMHKAAVRILPVQLTHQHFELLAKGHSKDFFPIPLKPDILQKCGFIENKKYGGLPEIRQFVLPLPVMGNNENAVHAFVKENTPPYARALVNELVISHNFHHVHTLQNLYYALSGQELEITL